MIAKVTRGSGFIGLQSYLLSGKNRDEEDRVGWIATRNLASSDPEIAAVLMRDTAAESRKVKKPVYHLSLNLAPEERLGREELLQVVERTLRDIGLEEHEALIVAHRDTPHQHVHVMVNRVHPKLLRAWDNRHDYARLERSLRHQELELGLRQVPGRHSPLPGQERHVGVQLSSGDRRHLAITGERPFALHVREVARRDLRESQSWEELHSRLRDYGLHLEKRGRGLVLTDGRRRVKASFVDRDSSLGRLQKRLGSFKSSDLRSRGNPAADRWRHIHELRRTAERLAIQRTGAGASPIAQASREADSVLKYLNLKKGVPDSAMQIARRSPRVRSAPSHQGSKAPELSQTAMRLVSRLGWNLVARVVPAPHLQLLRLTISLSRKMANTSLELERGGRR